MQLIKFGRLVCLLTASTSILRLGKPMGPSGGSGTGRDYPRPFDEVDRLKLVLCNGKKNTSGYMAKFVQQLALGDGGEGGGRGERRFWLTRVSSITVLGSSSRPFEQHQNCSMNDMQRSISLPIFYFPKRLFI